MSKSTILAESQISQSTHDVVNVELVQPDADDLPAYVQIAWPLQPSVIDPGRFRDTAATMVRLFSEAHVALTRIKARRHP
jgi:hypothetical protein